MKKLSIVLLVVVLAFFGTGFEAKAIGISIKFEFGKHTTEGNCGPGRGICSITIGVSLKAAPGETGVEVVTGDAVLNKDVLTLKLTKSVSEKGINENGLVSFVILKPTPLDKATARQLGALNVILLPGKYVVENNSLVLKVKAVDVKRDSASGMATGRR